jgi:hypothetical protein
MQAIRSLCSRCIRLDKGALYDDGEAGKVVSAYLTSFDVPGGRTNITDRSRRFEYIQRPNVIRISNASFLNTGSRYCSTVCFKEPFLVRLTIEVLQPVDQVRIGLGITTLEGVRISTSHYPDMHSGVLSFLKGVYTIDIAVQNNLVPGEYFVQAGIHELKLRHGLEHIPRAAQFRVTELSLDGDTAWDAYNIGFANLEVSWGSALPIVSKTNGLNDRS